MSVSTPQYGPPHITGPHGPLSLLLENMEAQK